MSPDRDLCALSSVSVPLETLRVYTAHLPAFSGAVCGLNCFTMRWTNLVGRWQGLGQTNFKELCFAYGLAVTRLNYQVVVCEEYGLKSALSIS
jgi:hypothetical protein